jgi:hypothetical protein
LDSYLSGIDPTHPDYHRYSVGPSQLCSTGDAGCSRDIAIAIAAANTVPVLPNVLYRGDGAYDLPFPFGSDRIVLFSPSRGIWINVTRPEHRYHPGVVAHAVFEHAGGVYLYTVGVGTGPNPANNVRTGQLLFGLQHATTKQLIYGLGLP